MAALFSPLTIRGTTFRNRLWVSPLCQYSVENGDGVPTDWHLVHLGSFAIGGAGLVMTEATAVSDIGRISPQDTGLFNGEQRDAWARIVNFVRGQGAVAGIQLAHAGRKASTWRPWGLADGTVPLADGGWQSVAPSAIPFTGYATPRALTLGEIAEVIEQFVAAARLAVEAGFEVLEVHAAHGYLLHEFLSPLANARTDDYGGSLENRARLLLEIVAAIRVAVGGSIPVFVRFSATDWAEKRHPENEREAFQSWDVEQTTTVAGWARDAGADLFDISTGGLISGVSIPVGPGYQVPFAAQIHRGAAVPVNAVGLITTAQQAEDIVARGDADAIMMGRQMMRDPHFAWRAAAELGVELDYYPPQYLRARYRLSEFDRLA
ncbi:MAG: NADH:flavin oxidoreductase/NADH oxidase [Salinibacterium sp.]|nr:NADH:flavin oxidoreductase/NADH oxidase [Salinibacterium sp.]